MDGIKYTGRDLEFLEGLINIGDWKVYSGSDAIISEALKRSVRGVISLVANLVPDKVRSVLNGGEEDMSWLLELREVLKKGGSQVSLKSALRYLGYDFGDNILPLKRLGGREEEVLFSELKRLGI